MPSLRARCHWRYGSTAPVRLTVRVKPQESPMFMRLGTAVRVPPPPGSSPEKNLTLRRSVLASRTGVGEGRSPTGVAPTWAALRTLVRGSCRAPGPRSAGVPHQPAEARGGGSASLLFRPPWHGPLPEPDSPKRCAAVAYCKDTLPGRRRAGLAPGFGTPGPAHIRS
jgi:hypothetical protein